MQGCLDLGAGDHLTWIRDRLRPAFAQDGPLLRLDPLSQLVRSFLGSKTKDAVSWAAFWTLRQKYPTWPELALASPHDVEAVIADVNLAKKKAGEIIDALRYLGTLDPPFSLDFLDGMSTEEAMAWLRRIDGVGVKIAASTVNFSTFGKAALVIDTHVLRVLQRVWHRKCDRGQRQGVRRRHVIGGRLAGGRNARASHPREAPGANMVPA